jgi:hypothetical protein
MGILELLKMLPLSLYSHRERIGRLGERLSVKKQGTWKFVVWKRGRGKMALLCSMQQEFSQMMTEKALLVSDYAEKINFKKG